MEELLILQRIVPHYRVPLFEELYRRFGWKVVCASNPPGNTGLSLCREADFIHSFPYRFPYRDWPYLTYVPVRRIIKELEPRAIIAEFSLQMSSTWELALSRGLRRNRAVLFWSHGTNVERPPEDGPMAKAFDFARRKLAERVDGHITYTEGGRRYLLEHTAVRTCFVAPNSLDIAAIRRVAENAVPKVVAGAPVIVTIGRITRDKDLPRLIEAFRLFQRHFPRAVLYVIGGELGSPPAAAEPASGSIHFVGPLYDETQIASYFKAADICAIPGAAGLSVNHALAYGVPVLLYEQDRDGPRHHPEAEFVVENVTGWRVTPHTAEALAARLLDLFARQPWPKQAIANRLQAYVDQNMHLENMIEGFRQVRQFLAASGPRQAALRRTTRA